MALTEQEGVRNFVRTVIWQETAATHYDRKPATCYDTVSTIKTDLNDF